MEANEIKSKTIYFYVYINDPTKINFSYQLLTEGNQIILKIKVHT